MSWLFIVTDQWPPCWHMLQKIPTFSPGVAWDGYDTRRCITAGPTSLGVSPALIQRLLTGGHLLRCSLLTTPPHYLHMQRSVALPQAVAMERPSGREWEAPPAAGQPWSRPGGYTNDQCIWWPLQAISSHTCGWMMAKWRPTSPESATTSPTPLVICDLKCKIRLTSKHETLTQCWVNVRWPNINPALWQHLVFAGWPLYLFPHLWQLRCPDTY